MLLKPHYRDFVWLWVILKKSDGQNDLILDNYRQLCCNKVAVIFVAKF